ncbi:hypothetical protein T09_4448 [Trichinella sp. T9]|nr:hypothetical protein T09_4448 [Trichinella sp. T9]
MAAAPMSKLNFASQTNDAHEKFPDEFSHPEISRQSFRNPPIAMLLRKSNAVRWEKWKCLICNGFHVVIDNGFIFGDFTKQNYQNLKHDPSIAVLSRKMENVDDGNGCCPFTGFYGYPKAVNNSQSETACSFTAKRSLQASAPVHKKTSNSQSTL